MALRRNFCAECGTPLRPPTTSGSPGASYTDLERALSEALEQQAVTGEILRVISSSRTDLQSVLDAVAENASTLCRAANVSLYQAEGDLMRKVAEHEVGPQLTTLSIGETRPIRRTSVSGRAIIDRVVIRVRDHRSADVASEFPDARQDTGICTTIGFPLLREGNAIGAFTVYRTEPRPFSEREIALLHTFADQAVMPSKTSGYSPSCRHGIVTSPRRWSSRRRPPTSSRSSADRRSTSSLCWTP
jgi:GAF domain-containing protein